MNRITAGEKVGYLLPQYKFKDGRRVKWNCVCTLCNSEKNIREDALKSGKTISCGCYKKSEEYLEKVKTLHQIEDLTGKVYSELTVLCLSDKRIGKKIMWTCLCSCGKIVDVWSANLKNGNTKTCGDYEAHRINYMKEVWKDNLDDLRGNKHGDWIVLYRDENKIPTRWMCECQNCGTIKSVLASSLKSGKTKNCGCKRHNPSLEGKKIGHWVVIKKSKRKRPNGHYCTTYFCRCECGTERYVDESRLLNGKSLSCGCYSSKANEYISSALKENSINFEAEYSYEDLKGPKGGLLRFDFAIKDNDGNVLCLIEYQGKQHYLEKQFGKEQREITDPLKKDYCKNKNILLFEIKYSDNIDKELDKILSHIAC